jgi:hypothetical protein
MRLILKTSEASFRSLAAAARLALAIERVAEALMAEDEPVPQNGPGLVRAHGVMRP